MRVSNEDKQRSRARILQAASKRFREGGIEGTSLAMVMQDAGMTHGGFYKHFADKEALVRAALTDAFDSFVKPLAETNDTEALNSFRDRYLSHEHRDAAGQGCPVAALGPEVARAGGPMRDEMTAGVEAMIAQLQRHWTDAPEPRAAAIRDLATLVGAIVIARAVEGTLSEEILTVSLGG